MLKRTRKRSAQITLVLLGAAALTACGDDQSEQRDLYTSKQDCVQDWGDEKKCEVAPDGASRTGHSSHVGPYFWGPMYARNSYRPGSNASVGSLSPSRSGSRAVGSTSVSRGGFGSSSSSHSSGS